MTFFLSKETEADSRLIKRIIDRVVVGGNDRKQACYQVALSVFTEPQWQDVFTNNSFLYIADYALNESSQAEVTFTLNCQVLESLYFFITYARDAYAPKSSFNSKFRIVFMHYYGWKVPAETAKALAIMRNRAAHTGTFHGLEGSERYIDEINWFSKYINKKYESINSSEEVRTLHLSIDFNALMIDIIARVLGLSQDDHLAKNGRPGWMLPIYGYEPGGVSTQPLNENDFINTNTTKTQKN